MLGTTQERPLHRLQEDFAYYDRLSRQRALTDVESRRLEGVIAKIDKPIKPYGGTARGRGYTFTPTDDAALIEGRKAGLTFSAIGRMIGRGKSSCVGRYRYLKGLGLV